MKYVSIDLETTGLNPKTSDIIEFGAVLDDLENPRPIEELPRFHCYVIPTPRPKGSYYIGEPYALSMHSAIFRKIANRDEGYNYYGVDLIMYYFRDFLCHNGYTMNAKGRLVINIAGKNAAMFDVPFLKEHISNWQGVEFSHRVLDPAMLFLKISDNRLPDGETCKKRAGLEGLVSHTAIEDAIMVIRLLRKGYGLTV
jgi:DNA polymerase III epsilon subunit-like protein